MEDNLLVGKVVGTHGIKGEIKIYSDLLINDRIFKVGNNLYFDKNKTTYKISGVRFHKGNYLVLLDGFNNINDVLFLNKSLVYIDRSSILQDNEYVFDDLIGFEVIEEDKSYGYIRDYEYNGNYATFLVEGCKKIYLPNVSKYIENIDLENKKVYTKCIGDLIL